MSERGFPTPTWQGGFHRLQYSAYGIQPARRRSQASRSAFCCSATCGRLMGQASRADRVGRTNLNRSRPVARVACVDARIHGPWRRSGLLCSRGRGPPGDRKHTTQLDCSDHCLPLDSVARGGEDGALAVAHRPRSDSRPGAVPLSRVQRGLVYCFPSVRGPVRVRLRGARVQRGLVYCFWPGIRQAMV